MENKRVLLTVALSVVIIVGWFWLFPPKPPSPAQPQPQPTAAQSGSTTGDSKPVGAASAPAAPPPSETAPAVAAAARKEEVRTEIVRSGLYRAVFTTRGAAPAEFVLLHPRFTENVWTPRPEYVKSLPAGAQPVRAGEGDPNWEQKQVPINMVRKQSAALPFEITFPESDIALAADATWELAAKSDEELVYATDVGPGNRVHVEKRWRLPREGYQLGLVVSVENRAPAGEKAVNEHLAIAVTGWQDPLVKPGGFSFGRRYNLTDIACDIASSVTRKNLDDSVSKPFSEVGDVKWTGVGEQFFLMAAAFAPEANLARRCSLRGDPSGHMFAETSFARRTIAPGQKVEYPMVAFIGPKKLEQLDAINFNGADARLGQSVNYTLEWLARPMLWVLKGIQHVVINWGIAIILFTVLLKAITYYPTMKSMKSMRQMAALKPDMDRIKEKYKDDKNKQNQEVMALYKKHGVNPIGGCLPTLLQMPIYIAFYSMLGNAVELYHAGFVGPIDDMTAPYMPLAVVTGGLMFLQQRLAPQTPDSQQQKMMMWMMPIMFTAFTIFLPSGLTLYILTNSLLTMAQQWFFNKSHPLPVAMLKTKKA